MGSDREGFTGETRLRAMPPLVVLAMFSKCDPDLTEVHFHTATPRFSFHFNEMTMTLRPPEATCLRCFRFRLAPFVSDKDASVWYESALKALNNNSVVVTRIRLYEEGEKCRCKQIP